MLTTSELTDKIDQALAKAQGEFPIVERDSRNPHFKSTYASLAAIWVAVRGPLAKNGISITQHPGEGENGKLLLQTRLAAGGQWIMSTCSVPVAKQDVQGWGAALTYAKRYALQAIIGLADDDDDGETAVGRPNEPKANTGAQDSPQSPPPPHFPPGVRGGAKGSGFTPAQQVTKAMNDRKLNPEVVGRWLRAKYPRLDYRNMGQDMAEQILKVFAVATDQTLEDDVRA